jgi:uncharacterized SAM-binding protein YcdF (DUF218 family)
VGSGKPIGGEIFSSAQTLWDYMHMNQPLRKSDVAIAMGSHDVRVAEYAAGLVLEGWAPLLICSGGYGRLTEGVWKESEASIFTAAAEKSGLPTEKIVLEDRSTNTGENLLFSRDLCEKIGIPTRDVLLVHKPYMERRVWAAAGKMWPEMKAVVASPPFSFEAFPTCEITREMVIHIMVGDFQRILAYPEKGFALPQEVPNAVMQAYEILVQCGYTQHLL